LQRGAESLNRDHVTPQDGHSRSLPAASRCRERSSRRTALPPRLKNRSGAIFRPGRNIWRALDKYYLAFYGD
jgi:hypothetical protein